MMGNGIKVSIIMGTYNDSNTLDRCIKSILNQTLTNWEFIICDDHSDERCLSILKKYESQDLRIRVIRNSENKGLAFSLNKCLKEAEGTYIARMDADDESLPNRLLYESNYLDEHPDVGIVGCNMIIFDGKNDKGIRKLPSIVTKESFLQGSPFAHPTVLVRKEILDEVNGYNTNVGRAEDLDLWFRIYERGYIGRNLQVPAYKYTERITDYKKRTLKNAFKTSLIMVKGYRKLKLPIIKYYNAFRPIVSSLIPNKIMSIYHYHKLS